MQKLAFRVEYARSGNSTCKICDKGIVEDALRLAHHFESSKFGGIQTNWFHPECFFIVNRPQTIGDIDGFHSVRAKDQNIIREEIEICNNMVEYVPTYSDKTLPEGKIRLVARMCGRALQDFGIEYAKSNRSSCRHCEMKIEKFAIRVRKTVYESEIGVKFGGEPLWHHLECFQNVRFKLGWLGSGHELMGFDHINSIDQRRVDEMIKPETKIGNHRTPKAELPDDDEIERSLLLGLQNEDYFENRDFCERFLNRSIVESLLEINLQEPPIGMYDCLDLLADTLAFGALERCPYCDGQLYLLDNIYQCTDGLSNGCGYASKTPDRKAAIVMPDLRKRFRFLDRKYYPCERLFHDVEARMHIQRF